MATRELLLLTLVFILVALATVMAIFVVQETQSETAKDNVNTQLLNFAAEAQGWALKPAFIGGGDKSFQHFSWSKIRADSIQPDIQFLYEVRESGKSLVLIGMHALVEDTLSLEVRLPEGVSMR